MSSTINNTLDNIIPTMDTMDYNTLISVCKSLEGLMGKAKQLLNTMSPTTPSTTGLSSTELPNISDCRHTCDFLNKDLSDRLTHEIKGLDYHHSMKANSPSTFQYSDSYTYVYNQDTKNAKSHPITPVMKELLSHANTIFNADFNHILINKYHNLKCFLGPHQDDEKQLDPSSPVATISLGVTRRLRISAPPDHNTHKKVDDVLLKPSTCFLMLPGFQDKYFHSLLPGRSTKPEEKGRRYSITLRKLVANPGTNLSPAPVSSPVVPELPQDPKNPVAAFTNTSTSSATTLDTIVFGSSLTKGLDSKVLSKYDKSFKVFSNGGAAIKTIQNDVEKAVDSGEIDCTAITSLFFICGGNDIENIKKNSDLSRVQKDYNNLVQYAQITFPNARINVVSLIPRRTTYYGHKENMISMNEWLDKYCKDYHARFVNIFSFFLNKKSLDLNYKLFKRDELHFTDIGDSVLAKVLLAVSNRPRALE